jgi:hypothetical protein
MRDSYAQIPWAQPWHTTIFVILGDGIVQESFDMATRDEPRSDVTADAELHVMARANGRPPRTWKETLDSSPRSKAREYVDGLSPFPPIGDYAFLSDCEVTALIAPSGNVEWMCLPRLQVVEVDRGCYACMLGGPDRRTLFIMAAEFPGASFGPDAPKTGQVLTVQVDVPGVGWP